MDLLLKEKEMWNNHFSGLVLEYPDEEVVRFLNRHKKRKGCGRLIDIGCGTGRHTLAALRLGYEVIAMDFFQNCLDVTRQRVTSEGKSSKYILNNNTDIPVEDESIDTALAWGCLFHNNKNLVLAYMKEINRVLKANGELYCDFRIQKDAMYTDNKNYGTFIDKNVLLLNENTGMAGGHIYFPTLDELKMVVSEAGFKLENIEQYEFTERNMTKLNSWYHLLLIKR